MRHKKYNKLLTIKRREYEADELGDNVLSESETIAETWGSIGPEAGQRGGTSGDRSVKYDQNIRSEIVDIKCHYPRNWKPDKDMIIEWRGEEYQVQSWQADARGYELVIEAIKVNK